MKTTDTGRVETPHDDRSAMNEPESGLERAQGAPIAASRRHTLLPYWLVGTLSSLMYIINVVVMFPFFFLLGILKFIIPIPAWQTLCRMITSKLGTLWVSVNTMNLHITKRMRWDVTLPDDLRITESYLVISNHRSWSDILVLQKVFNRRIPFLTFFLKKELIWVPLLGLAWWALDFPFMKRYSEAYLKRHPQKRGKDIEITRRACKKFRNIPVSIMNFVEGTRLTPEKHERQRSPFANLLKPKAGGIAFVLSTIGQELHKILNVTIAYPHGNESFWGFVAGKVPAVKVYVEEFAITPEIIGDYANDEQFRERFQEWVNQLWIEKDRRLSSMLAE